jgi:acetyl-CoA decarbonylase/synthase complex subunit gamma
MALTGLDIYKHLPKTNCGKCGVPTCLAFAMQLAGKKTSLEKCPFVTEQVKQLLEGASAPPIRLVTIGTGDNKLEIGQETVMFRHEQTFFHPCGIAVEVADNLPEAQLTAKAKEIEGLVFERVAQKLKVELIALKDVSGNPETFAKAARTVAQNFTRCIILMSENPSVMEAGLKAVADRRPLAYGANAKNFSVMGELAKKYSVPLGVAAKGIDELADLTPKVTAMGVNDIVIDPGQSGYRQLLNDLTQIRRQALKKSFRPLGFPTIVFSPNADPMEEAIFAATEFWHLMPAFVMRQNVFTDPQKPIQIESKLYEIGAVTENSPVIITTNFSLTYFTVEPEVEASKVPTYIMVVNTEGQSVLTAYSSDKLNEKVIAKTVRDLKVEERVKHRKIVLPGYVSQLSGKLEGELGGWEVIVGPREASALPAFLKSAWK